MFSNNIMFVEVYRYWEMLLVSSTLPLLALIAVFLRRNFFKGRIRIVMMMIGFLLLGYVVYDQILEHSKEMTLKMMMVGFFAAVLTFIILSFSHKHTAHNKDVKAIAFSEFFHSLMDGAVIGMAYVVSPMLGIGTALGIITHELPKMLGTVFLIRGMTDNILDTIKYSFVCQAGVPLAAVLVYTFGKNLSESWSEAFEFGAIVTLAAILIRIATHSFLHRGHDHN